jgi:hypothetical protein
MLIRTSEGGVLASLGEGVFLEEYPTDPPSLVLNGGIFAMWGVYDVWRAFGDERAAGLFQESFETLCEHIVQWDTGFWSRYDLYPHRVANIASPSYHALHVAQLTALELISPSEALETAAARFRRYARSRLHWTRAVVHKVAFRLLVRKGVAAA